MMGSKEMTEEEYQSVRPVVEMAMRLESRLHAQLVSKGVAPIDALIAATYSGHALAAQLHACPIAAIEWMRDALDTIERQLLAGGLPN
jgi:hypothetical protein